MKTLSKGLLLAVISLSSIVANAAISQPLKLASTTSANDSGLLNYLAPKFTQATGIKLTWVSVGSGKALELGQACKVDVVLVHSPKSEKMFVSKGYGINRQPIMYNNFIIVGPKSDPDHIKGKSVLTALRLISKGNVPFVSRTDNSGTHQKELQLWQKAKVTLPANGSAKWYRQSYQGMLATLTLTSKLHAYTMTDRSTYLKYISRYKKNPPLVTLVANNKLLKNQYNVIIVNPKHCPKTAVANANKFIQWLTGKDGQLAIGSYQLQGKVLFNPVSTK